MVRGGEQEFQYPFVDGAVRPWRLDVLHQTTLLLQDGLRIAGKPRSGDVRLAKIGDPETRPLSRADMPLVFLTRNDRRYLPSFFKHYRSMGVTRFICVDDRSTDGTREYLLDQKDADVYHSNVRYLQAARGKVWRELLFGMYGRDRWYLNVDSDEYLVYEGMERRTIHDLADCLFGRGVLRFPAPMIDLYPAGPLHEAVFEGRDETMPWEVATHFDQDGYRGRLIIQAVSICGGVRARLFDDLSELIKYPLLYWSRACSLGRTIHRPRPSKLNFAPVFGCMLHCRIFSDVREQAQRAIDNGQHYRGARHYRHLLEGLDRSEMKFAYDRSLAYRGPEDLVERGFMLPAA